MAFWSKRADPRGQAWLALAEEFELTPAPELADALREHFDLGPGELGPIYGLSQPGQPQLLAFDQVNHRSGPLGRVANFRTGVVVRARAPHAAVSLRASSKRHAVLEGLEAGRSGAQRLDAAFDEDFDAAVSVYAREGEAAGLMLTSPVRAVLLRLLKAADEALAASARRPQRAIPRHASGKAPSVAIGPRNLFLSLEAETPIALDVLENLIVDLLSLHVALLAAGRVTPQHTEPQGS